MTSFTDELRDSTGKRWEEATRHRFVEEFHKDSLQDEVFRRYLVDDYAFLEEGARLTALAAGKAPGMEEMGRLAQQLSVLTGGENDYFLRAFDDLGVSEEDYTGTDVHPNTQAFIDFVLRVAHEGSYDEVLTVITAAEWVYLDWCRYAAEGEQSRWYLDEWVEIHVIDEFIDYVGWLRNQLDDIGRDISPRRREAIEELFVRTVELEVRFFGAAYEE